MQILKVNKLRGPNIWSNSPVLEAWVDLEELKDTSSEMIPGFNERLMAWLPTMVEHRCSVGERGGFFVRLRRGTYMAHILEHITLELQSLAGTPVGFGRARETNKEGVYKVAISYREEKLGLACLDKAFELLQAAVHDRPFDVDAEVEKLKEYAYDVCLGPSTKAIVDAAKARNIPWRRLNEGSLVQLGYGHLQRRICTAEADTTSAIAESIAQDKDLTRMLLKTIGVPTPEGQPVESAEEAWEVAQDIGLPVVIKPQYGNHGRGVATNLQSREQVEAAYRAAREEGSSIVCERHAPGDDYRILVIGGRMVAAARREPAHVIGDGQSTVQKLIDVVNEDPRRSDGHSTVLSKIKIDAVALGVLMEQGLTPDTIPPLGKKVLIRRNANLSTGGTAADVTDIVHPDVARQCVEAARVIGLDIAGVDVVAQDITQPLQGQRGVIVEINAGPGLRMHIEPSSGQGRPVGEAIIDMMFPEGNNGRVPIVSVTGVNGKTTTTRLVSHIVGCTGKKVGMTCTDGIYIHGRRIDSGDCSGPQSARSVLMNPAVEAAVLETARGGILREGLGFDFCDVGIVTNIGEGDHLGLSDIETLEQLAKVKRCVIEAVSKTGYGVLKANDPYTAEMAERCKGGVIFFAIDGNDPVLSEHRSKGGRAAFVRDNAIILAEGTTDFPLLSLERIPLTHNGRITFQVENVLAAAAACWGLGMPCEQIRLGLESFSAHMDKVPGRFNLVEMHGATVIVDYGHNASSLMAIAETLEQFPHEHRTVIYSAAGDRRDEDMVRQGEILANHFDRIILYEDQYLRGRQPGEIMSLFKKGMDAGRKVKEIHEVSGWPNAVDRALKLIRKGDLLLMQADTIDEAVQYLQRAFEHESLGREIDLDSAIHKPAEKGAPTPPKT
ncbi:Cyanophycin synthetase [Pirellula sp. SH-Sr6A]|uniref:cyanophycin synthetase n=1 Tax=Pirellula sp. SH-Sr6A TaxID=1632865 RepID=UPI00078B9614|nr:cyanophycin synthetase [Pirellula sp. SH-Sr6A]AMV32376.1 Cyanophycin synthetase [Pirellula sp. SH-Sr6A]